jgi:hypothetical protein
MATDEQRGWATQVLGVAFGSAAAQTGAQGGALMPIWQQAKETVDAGLGRLQNAFRKTGDEDLVMIADYGLYGVTQGQNVKLMAAIMDADSTKSPAALKKLAKAAQSYRAFLDGAPVVDLIEKNPFGVSVGMRQTLGAALTELQQRASA